MKKKNIIMVAALAALATLGGTTAITLQAKGGLGVFATSRLNEYGCEYNCTGEYYPSSVNSIVKANPELSGKKDVRLIAKKSKGNGLFQDITYGNTVENTYSYRNSDKVIMVNSFTAAGFSSKDIKEGETVAFFGTVVYRKDVPIQGGKLDLVEINNATIYMIGDVKDLSLLPPLRYLQ